MIKRFEFPGPAVWPTALSELAPAEHLVVWAFRRGALAIRDNTSHHMCLVWNEFARQFGTGDGKAALSSFMSIVGGLQENARRNIHHHQPCCPCLGADEVWLVCLVGSCQRGEPRQARFLAEQMVRPDGVGSLLEAAGRLGHAMREHALLLPYRDGEIGSAGNLPVTVH